MNAEEVLKVVQTFNDSLSEMFGETFDDECYYLTCEVKYSDHIVVKFLNIEIFNNRCDDRKYLEECDEYEPLELHLFIQIKKNINEINKLFKNLPIVF